MEGRDRRCGNVGWRPFGEAPGDPDGVMMARGAVGDSDKVEISVWPVGGSQQPTTTPIAVLQV